MSDDLLLPPPWRAEFSCCKVSAIRRGMSGTSVFHIRCASGDRYLKISGDRGATEVRDEIVRTSWLQSQGVSVPRILRAADDGKTAAVLTAALAGNPADETGDPGPIASIARAFAALHSLPVQACPFDETIRVRLARAREAVANGLIEPAHFDTRNAGCTPQQVLDRLETHPRIAEDIVVVHGDATFSNILIDGRGGICFIDCGRAGRADRYVDLSLLTGEIEEHLGKQWVETFHDAYGLSEWDQAKATFYNDLYELF